VRKIFSIAALCLILATGILVAQQATGEWTINADGVVGKISPMEINGKLYCSIDDIGKSLGMEVSIDKAVSTILLKRGDDPARLKTAGSISGEVNVKYRNVSLPVVSQDVYITAPNTDPDPNIAEQIRWHFYGGDRSYFIKHPYLGSGKIDKDGKFIIPNVTVGQYDLLFFTSTKSAGGSVRFAWKLRVWVDPGQETKVRLDDFNKAYRYGRFLQ
jgi:hypothetical protein